MIIEELELRNNEKLKQENKYISVKEKLPPDDGLFYDVLVILYEDNISGCHGYYIGKYQNSCFFVNNKFYLQKNNFRNDFMQLKVIAWKPLPICNLREVTKFISEAKE